MKQEKYSEIVGSRIRNSTDLILKDALFVTNRTKQEFVDTAIIEAIERLPDNIKEKMIMLKSLRED